MNSAFIAYRQTGEDPDILGPMLTGVSDEFNRLGIDAYCTFFDIADFQDKSLGAREIMIHAFETIQNKDFLFVIMTSSAKSDGMIMEVGRFFGVKPIIVAKHQSVDGTYIPDMADVVYEWSSQEELIGGIADVIKKIEEMQKA